MVETLTIITGLSDRGVKVIFVRQPELSTAGVHGKLILAIYSYFAEAERDFISLRTKHALAVLKAQGRTLGRPKGSRNKAGRRLDPMQTEIAQYLKAGLSMRDIHRLIVSKNEISISYMAVKNYINDRLRSYR
jgi:DNA invertase Pin-like site-specific DNA recombinase